MVILRLGLLPAALFLLLALTPPPAAALWPPHDGPAQWTSSQEPPEPEFLHDALVVKMRRSSGAGAAGPRDLLADQPVEDVVPLFTHAGARSASARLAGVFRVSFRAPVDVLALSRRLARHPDVVYAEPVLRARITAMTNDPYLSSSGAWGQAYQDLWGLHKIAAPTAWDQSTGQGIVVAVVDTGSDLTHPDLAANLWQNPGETAGNFQDDDGNGFVDDVRGWDFVSNDADPFDDHAHGTHVAGTIAAVAGNGAGVAGVAWRAKIMSLKGLDGGGSGDSDKLAEAIVYAAENGAHVINMSWRSIGVPEVVEDALAAAYDLGVVLVAAAGNDYTEAWRAHPASSRYVLCIGASTPTDQRAQFSNSGGSVDVLAPGGADTSDAGGSNILSLRSSVLFFGVPPEWYVGDRYLRFEGTSMAAPHVAGLAALLLEEQPGLTPEEVRQVIRRSAADVSTAGWDSNSGFGRIAAPAALDGLGVRGTARILSPRARSVLSGFQVDILGSAMAPAFSSFTLEYGLGVGPTAWTHLATSAGPVSRGPLATWDISQRPDGVYTLRLTALNASGQRFEDRLEVVIDNVRFTSPAPDTIFRGGDVIQLTGWSYTPNFSHYLLEYLDPVTNTWKSDGITLTGGGLTPVEGGVLGSWNTVGLTRADYYRVRLTAYRQDGSWDRTEMTLLIDPFLHPGWPRTLSNYSEGIFSLAVLDNSTAADVDGDGTLELLFAQGDTVHVFRHDGTYLPGWPQPLPAGHIAQQSPAAGDLDGDGKLEMAIAHFGDVYIFDSDGTRLGPLGLLGTTVAIGDVLGDSRPELIVTGYSDFYGAPVWVLDAAGNPLVTPYRLQRVTPGATQWPFPSRPVLADLDGNGKLDIAVANTNETLELHAFRGDGTSLPGFPFSLGIPSQSYGAFHPTAADLDADGWPDIVVGNASCQTFAVSRTGQILPGWPFQPAEPLTNCGPATMADLNGDGKAEVVIGASSNGLQNAVLFVLSSQGQMLPGWPQRWGGSSSFYGAGAAALVDVDGDGARELIVDGDADSQRPFALRGFELQGGTVPGFPRPTANIGPFDGNTPAILDLDADGLLEIAWVNFNGQIFVWDLPVPARVSVLDWPMFRHDAGHTATVPSSRCSVVPTALDFHPLTPCRVVDTRGVPGPRGGPVLSSGVPRLLPVTGTCGVPPTARAVVINVTVAGPTAAGNLSFSLGGCPTPPGTSTINLAAGVTRANLAILPLATNGTGAVTVFPLVVGGGTVHLILDVTGYFE